MKEGIRLPSTFDKYWSNQSNGIKTKLIVACKKGGGGYYCGETFDKGWGWYQSVGNKTPLTYSCMLKEIVERCKRAKKGYNWCHSK